MKSVLVTGGNGHVGYNLVRTLSEKGYHVRASIRDLNDDSKTHFLKPIKNVELVEANLMDIHSLEKAMSGVEGIFHSAAPNLPWAPHPDKDIIQPTFLGTQNVFHAARKNKQIKRVVFTSSCGACGMDATLENPLTEADWNLTAQSALVRSKIDSERWAWDFASKNGIELITLHPPTILGPGFHRYTTSTKIYELILLGKLPPLPEGGCHLVDVRDLAEAHVRAYSDQNCSGRYIVAGQYFKISEFMEFLRTLNLGLKVPSFQSPRWALQGVRAVDWMLHQVSGRPRQLTGELIREFVGKYQHVSTERAVRDLGWSPRPAQETILDTFQWIREKFLNKEYSK